MFEFLKRLINGDDMSNIVEFVQNQADIFNDSISDQSITWAQESQFAIQAFQNNDFLAKVAMSNLQSAQNALINIAAIGITLNPASKLAYLVPREGRVCLDISYMGLLHLAQLSGSIIWGQCKLVHEEDTYQSNGLSVAPSHTYDAFSKTRGEVVGGYCTVKTVHGDFLTDEMSIAEINAIRDRSPGWKSGKKCPWRTDENEMGRKTIVKRSSKYWPKVARLDMAINHLNTDGGEGITLSQEKEVRRVSDPLETLRQMLSNREPEKYLPWLKVSSLDDLTPETAEKAVIALENAAK